ncbi:MAG: hypothetical protein KBF99_02000 [Leptospiraceae bacterium]|nr:hypothetical protein [Leptospiraceae bacterium]
MDIYDMYIYVIGYIGLACWILLAIKFAVKIIARDMKKELKENEIINKPSVFIVFASLMLLSVVILLKSN